MASLALSNSTKMSQSPVGGARRPRTGSFPETEANNRSESSLRAKQRRVPHPQRRSNGADPATNEADLRFPAASATACQQRVPRFELRQVSARHGDDSRKLQAAKPEARDKKKRMASSPPNAQQSESSAVALASVARGSQLASHEADAPPTYLLNAPATAIGHSASARGAAPLTNGSSLVAAPPSLPDRAPCDTHGTATSSRSPAAAASGRFRFASQCPLPTGHGDFIMRVYVCSHSGKEAVVMLAPQLASSLGVALAVDPAAANQGGGATAGAGGVAAPNTAQPSDSMSPTADFDMLPLVRVHDACATSELFGSLKCDCKVQLDSAMRMVLADTAGGAVVYLQQEGRGIGLANKVAAYALQQGCGADTVDANRALGLPDDVREYAAVRDIFEDLKVSRVRLLTNNPRKVAQLEALGVTVARRVPLLVTPPSELARGYLNSKIARMQHFG